VKLQRRKRIGHGIRAKGTMSVECDSRERREDDPALGAFLDFLARDMASHPERLRSLEPGIRKRARSLISKVKVHLEVRLLPENE